ncbi:MAG TPA: hypothetical protein PLH63_04700 [Candidatus Cloacimonadota bacterium]|nr:hypothetical protein [Candidatus Cloacimonadota bacterium]
MRKIIILLLVLTALMIGCDKRNSGLDVHKLSSEELLQQGWDSYLQKDFNNALPYFMELSVRPLVNLKGYHALGWTYLQLRQVNNSSLNFDLFFTADTLEIYTSADSLFQDVKAGQALNSYLLSDYTNCINTANQINSTWLFSYDKELNYSDITLLKVISYYRLQRYNECLDQVKLLDPSFNVDLNFIEGVIALGNKIESLKTLYRFYY